ncbi:DUF7530 family protein [Natronomonas salsuginis]|uniref:Uncharacterized protein n=1 Tax=Natronomonas salsuginis TaxID=2217661 RepID=A0A4U5JB30_9EURY|nr:hypothetical protein [Natronomonas salsuginis]TKR25785.1 hypothetical protein DM868_10300 [Natronomonas salsuginis]
MEPDHGETWAYESIIGALPGIDLSPGGAIAIQLAVFEVAVLGLGWYYDLRTAAVAGTAAVVVAALGSAEMLRISAAARQPETPEPYRRLLFGSSIEVVLSVLAFVALVTHLFVFDLGSPEPLVDTLFGSEPPTLAVYLMLLILWDLCYRIGTGWWASIVGLWRSIRYRFDARTAAVLRRADREAVVFGLLQLPLLPFLTGQPVLFAALAAHVAAVLVVSGSSLVLLRRREY